MRIFLSTLGTDSDLRWYTSRRPWYKMTGQSVYAVTGIDRQAPRSWLPIRTDGQMLEKVGEGRDEVRQAEPLCSCKVEVKDDMDRFQG